MDRNDVWVSEAGGNPNLPVKTRSRHRCPEFRTQNLYGYPSAELQIFRQEDMRHPSSTNLTDDAVAIRDRF